MGPIASQITSLTIVYSTVYSDADQRKHQSSASLAFVRGIHRGPVNSPHKGPVTRKMFPFDDVIMDYRILSTTVLDIFTDVSHAGNSWIIEKSWNFKTICLSVTYELTVGTHGRQSVSNHRHIDFLFNRLFGSTTKKHQSSALQSFFRKPTVHRLKKG